MVASDRLPPASAGGLLGRTIYRRTKATTVPHPGRRSRRRIVKRPEDEWIEVLDATPAIISPELFESVQERLRDPERLKHGKRKSSYALAGRLRCRQCGASMVGQTLQRGRYRYYRCRKAFAGPRHDRCGSRYVRADALEQAVLEEAAAVLSRPDVVLGELRRLAAQDSLTEPAAAAAQALPARRDRR